MYKRQESNRAALRLISDQFGSIVSDGLSNANLDPKVFSDLLDRASQGIKADAFEMKVSDLINNFDLDDKTEERLRRILGIGELSTSFDRALQDFSLNAKDSVANLIGDLALVNESIGDSFRRFAENLVRSFARALVDYSADQINTDRWRQIIGTGASLVGRAFGIGGNTPTTNIGVQNNTNVQTSGQILDVNYINSQQDTTQQFPGS